MLPRYFGCCFTLFLALNSTWAQAEETKSYTHKPDVVFTEVHGIGLLMDIFTPIGDKNGLAIVDVASGSYFSDRGKVRQHEKFGVYQEFCSKGYTCFTVRPGSMTKFSIPEMADHVKLAIRWVRMHADEYGLDASRIGIVGASAGGHLASLVAMTGDDGSPTAKEPIHRYGCRVQALVAFFPPSDFLAWGDMKVDPEKTPGVPLMFKNILFAGPAVPRSPERLKAQMMKISPAHIIPDNCPPVFLVHGDADPVVPFQQSQTFHQRLLDKGVDVTFLVKAGGEHPWPTLNDEIKISVDWIDTKIGTSAVAKREEREQLTGNREQ